MSKDIPRIFSSSHCSITKDFDLNDKRNQYYDNHRSFDVLVVHEWRLKATKLLCEIHDSDVVCAARRLNH